MCSGSETRGAALQPARSGAECHERSNLAPSLKYIGEHVVGNARATNQDNDGEEKERQPAHHAVGFDLGVNDLRDGGDLGLR